MKLLLRVHGHFVFIRKTRRVIAILLYVDNMVITMNSSDGINLKNHLAKHYHLKDLCHLTFSLDLRFK